MNKAIFIDKDGTLIEDIPFNVDTNKIKLMPYVEELKKLQDRGYLIIVISNQTGVAKDLFSENDLIPIKDKLALFLKEKNIILSDFYYCPHDINGKIKKYRIRCNDHKPHPGMLLKAAKKHNIDLSSSWMIGDSLDDMQAGKNAGCNSIMISKPSKTPILAVKNLKEAVKYILKHE